MTRMKGSVLPVLSGCVWRAALFHALLQASMPPFMRCIITRSPSMRAFDHHIPAYLMSFMLGLMHDMTSEFPVRYLIWRSSALASTCSALAASASTPTAPAPANEAVRLLRRLAASSALFLTSSASCQACT